MTQISLPYNPQPGGAEDVTQINANFAAILAVVNGDIRNDNIHASAALAYSKLNLANAIKNGDIDPAAAIAVTKLAGGTGGQVLKSVGAVPTWSKTGWQLSNGVAVGTGANTVETNLQTVTIPANTLAVGDIVRISCAGTFVTGNGTVTLKLYFGTTVVLTDNITTGATSFANSAFVLVTGSATQKAGATQNVSNGGLGDVHGLYAAPAQAISGSIIVKTTGTTTNAADEITSEMLLVEGNPA